MELKKRFQQGGNLFYSSKIHIITIQYLITFKKGALEPSVENKMMTKDILPLENKSNFENFILELNEGLNLIDKINQN